MSLSNSDQIQLAALALTLLLAVAGIVPWALRRRRERKSLTVRAVVRGKDPAYVSELSFPIADRPARVLRVAVWVEVTISNESSTPVVLHGLDAQYDGDPLRPVGGPFAQLAVRGDDVVVRERLKLPVRIDAHDARRLFALAHVTIPEVAGAQLFRLYCRDVSESKMREWVADIEEQLRASFRDEVRVATLVALAADQMTIQDPLVPDGDGDLLAAPRFGRLSLAASNQLHNALDDAGLLGTVERPPNKYAIVATFGEGRRLSVEFASSRNVFWFHAHAG